ncbi:MAG: serine/threonine-protein kinase [Opitutaceae bacterium]|jgi:serine/threonine protein kinase/Flp pilus assembly protein TadD
MEHPSQREEELFTAALELPAAERQRYLEQACGGDTELLRRVQALLRVHEEVGDFLETPAVADRADVAHAGESKPLLEEAAGTMIGRYKLLQKIGEGGCGVVYMAEQEEPVRRRVALKVIRLGMDTREVIARFEAERQALALMDHPNIARVFDAGATDTGRPYFVMELVRGLKITDYCDQHNLSTAERLNLFIQVCHAVQHAHQKGIIHRDIKPSNILVTLQDGEPVPKVIDFGIAKATAGRLTDKTLYTAFEQFIGTPVYMSPEQAELSSVDVDTRSDIYSLGVLLYELLTGHTPFETTELLQTGLDEMRRHIREVEPPKPSTRLRTLEVAALTTTAQHRSTEPPKLLHLVRGDLDWIVMRCLEKKRARRYETANELARDLEHHLHDEPVMARPPSQFYRLQKLVRRNKLTFIAAGAIAVVLVIGLAVSTWMFFREKAARERAVAAEQAQARLRQQAQAAQRTAETEAAKSRQVAQFLTDMLKGVGPSVALGRDTTLLREILDKTAERLGKDLKEQPEVEAELRQTLGQVYRDLGVYAPAESMLRQSLDLRRRAHGDNDPIVAATMSDLGEVLYLESKLDEAENLVRRALAIQEKLWGKQHLDVARSWHRLGLILFARRKNPEAVLAYREALAIQRQLVKGADPEVAANLLDLGVAVYRSTSAAEGEALIREALEMRRKLFGNEHPDVADAMFELGRVLNRQLKRPEADAVLRDTLAMQRKLLGNDHPWVAHTLIELGKALRSRDPTGERERCLREALAIQKRLWPEGHPDMVGTLQELGYVCENAGRPGDAEACAREALDVIRKCLGEEHDYYCQTLNHLVGYVAEQPGRLPEAETIQRQALELLRRTGRSEGPYAGAAWHELGTILDEQGQLEAAEQALKQAVAIRKKFPPVAETGESLVKLAKVLRREHRLEERRSVMCETLAWADHAFAPDSLDAVLIKNDIAWEYYLAGEYADALSVGEATLAQRRKASDTKSALIAEVMDTVACTYEALGRQAEALALFQEALQLTTDRRGPNDAITLGHMYRLGEAYVDAERLVDAQSLLDKTLKLRRANLGAEYPDATVMLSELGRALLVLGNFVDAESRLREALSIQEKQQPDEWSRYHTQSLLGGALAGQRKFAEAEPLLLSGYDGLQQREETMSAWDRRFVRQALERLVQLYTDWGQPDKAAAWKRQLDELQKAEPEKMSTLVPVEGAK